MPPTARITTDLTRQVKSQFTVELLKQAGSQVYITSRGSKSLVLTQAGSWVTIASLGF